jgi:CubicO group peptidase (beta-lactamase class C family)
MSAVRLERLSATLQSYVDENQLAGAVALVARRGRTVFLEAFGDLDVDASTPMPEDAIFRIASQTKAIVSVGVMILQEEGRLLIEDPVGKYLPEYMETTVAVVDGDGGYEVIAAKRQITIRDLLTHTSGVGYGDGPAAELWEEAGIQGWYFANRDEPIRRTVERMAALPFEAHPGEKFIYGYSTDILGALIEEVSGMPLDRFLADRILEPLSMGDTHFYLPADKADRLATVYSAVEGDGITKAPDPGNMIGQGAYAEGPRLCFSGGAGLLSTAGDYARFLQMMVDGGELDGHRVLSPKTVELMTINHLGGVEFPLLDGVGFGLGFYVVEDLGLFSAPSSAGQYGWGGAYHSTYWVDPEEELVVVYLAQLIPAPDIDDHEKLRTLVYQAIVE